MKIIKIIDLLKMIANEEKLPKKIKFHNFIFELKSKYSYCEDYYCKKLGFLFSDEWALTNNLNEEIEIIEEEKEIKFELEELKEVEEYIDYLTENQNTIRLAKRINTLIRNQKKLIDAVNEIRKEK